MNTIHIGTKPVPKEKKLYAVIVQRFQDTNPTICNFYGTGNYSTNKKQAIQLAKDLSRMHTNAYKVICFTEVGTYTKGKKLEQGSTAK